MDDKLKALTEYAKTLKEGDSVYLWDTIHAGRVVKRPVEKVTKTGRLKIAGNYFHEGNEWKIYSGKDWSRSSTSLMLPQDGEERLKTQMAESKLKNAFLKAKDELMAKGSYLNQDQLDRIMAIIKEV